ncbi:MAG: histidinol-phosphate aminotransferase family protein [Proteobacteria bacterium]|nr:histidinol-phosphate aminotransferase family protein [Pseudomonadota bacterium]
MSIRPRASLLNPELRRPHALDSKPRDPSNLWLDKNENQDSALAQTLREVLESIPTTALTTYPEAGELYRKLAAWVDVDPRGLLLTPGSDGAIRLVFEAFVEPGDPVAHTVPTFAMYPVYSQMFGAAVSPIEYRASAAGPVIDPDFVLRAVRERAPKLLCLPNPDSPTGTVLPSQVLRAILTECERVGTVMLIDEAYHPFYAWSAAPWTAASPNLIVARTFAKAWGAAGLRIGYAVGHPDTIALLHKMRPMYEVSTLAVECMARMMDHEAQMLGAVARINAGKDFFARAMRAAGFSVLPGEGNFIHVAFGERAAAVQAALAGKVLYRAVSDHPSLRGYSRFSLAPQAVMARVADLILGAGADGG